MKDLYPARRSFFRTRTIDVTFTIILGLFTFVFGYYVITAIQHHTKVAKAKKALVVSAIDHHKTVRHQKKHRFMVSSKSLYSKIGVADTTEDLPSQQTSVIQPPTQTPVIQSSNYVDKNSMVSSNTSIVSQNEIKPVSDNLSTEKMPVKEVNLPYTTFLRANETGVINMRKFDNYGSPIIKVIPTNAEVAVLERGNSYYKVIFENTTGYVAKWNVLKK